MSSKTVTDSERPLRRKVETLRALLVRPGFSPGDKAIVATHTALTAARRLRAAGHRVALARAEPA